MPVDWERVCAALEREIGAAPGPGRREQREAVLRLRAGMCANPGLVALLSGADVVPAAIEKTRKPEDAEGARTVAKIAAKAAERGERVLIAAPDRAAADAAAALLPAELTVIRLETPESLAGVAGQLRRQALERTAGTVDPLLRDWRDRLSRPDGRLHRELLRHADVVASTWFGCGRPEFADLGYDLVVVDGADRIPASVAIVPMVRARRAVLVGGRSSRKWAEETRTKSVPDPR